MQAEIILRPTPPYEFERSFSFLGPSCPDPIAYWDGKTFQRVWPLSTGKHVLLSISSTGTLMEPQLLLTLEAEEINEAEIEQCQRQVAETLCLHLDLNAFYETIKFDLPLYQLCQRNIGLKPVLEPTLFEALSWAIIGQQVNLRFACQVKRGMLEKYGERWKSKFQNAVRFRYPEPSELANTDPLAWREFKCSRRKAEYIIGLARLMRDGFDTEKLKVLSDEEIIERLMQIRGIGRWTAEYVLIQGFGRWDALPSGDAGLINGIRKVYGLNYRPDKDEIISRAEAWRPYRGLATYYLWWAN